MRPSLGPQSQPPDPIHPDGGALNHRPQSAGAAAGDSKGYMYGGGGGRLWAFKGRDVITDRKISATLMNYGVSGGGDAAASDVCFGRPL